MGHPAKPCLLIQASHPLQLLIFVLHPGSNRFMNVKTVVTALIAAVIAFSCKQDKAKTARLIGYRQLNYPSGSGMAFQDTTIYIMGDDASYLLVMDTQFNRIDSILLFDAMTGRIPKEKKADIEAIGIRNPAKAGELVLTGSGSVSPFRDSCFIVNRNTRQVSRHSLDIIYRRLRAAGLPQLNIEGAVSIAGNFLLSNRGNKRFPRNQLVILAADFWLQQPVTDIKLIRIGVNTDTSFFNGISGMDYSYRSDRLYLSVSTENTYNTYDDGEIGKSYLWIINDFWSKRKLTALNPDMIIDLEQVDPRFAGQKLESVAIISEKKGETQLALVADDDKGGSVLFKLLLPGRK